MARVVDVDLTDQPRSGRKPEYPWDQWFDGQTWVLVEGEDYHNLTSFRSTVYSAAKRNNLEIRTKVIDGELHIQAVEPIASKSNGHGKKRVRSRTRS